MLFAKLFPRKYFFFELFEQHAEINTEVIKRFLDCLTSNIDPLLIIPIKTLEHQADAITRKCAEALHITFITPFDRDQIYLLICRMDDIIDCIDAAADCLLIYKIQSVTPELIELATILQKSISEVEKGIKGLRNLKYSPVIQAACNEINRLEHEADLVFRKAIGRLFDEETDGRQIIKWKEIYECLEQATDRCSDVADVLEGILLESD